MNATYRLQLRPGFGFREVRELLTYFQRLGVSHLYLSPITEAAPGSEHGYDVSDHNTVREELGGREGFEELREAAAAAGLALLLDFVPNHAGVGPGNPYWQDLLAYGQASKYAAWFDVDWRPARPDLRGKVLLPFLGSPYGEALDANEIALEFEDGRFFATYFGQRFALSPATYAPLLEAALARLGRQEAYFDLLDLTEAYRGLGPAERDKAEALRVRLVELATRVDLAEPLAEFRGERLHELLERQSWRLAYWQTAGQDINYRRFFDINGLAALRMEEPAAFWDTHRLLGDLLLEPGVAGVRIDHVDGLYDPHGYLESLRALGARDVWVEKILAPGETLPEGWQVCGTTGYEFMNDALRLLVLPAGEEPLLQAYRRFTDSAAGWEEVVAESKVLVMETSLAGGTARLARDLLRLAEADYRTRDFTLAGLQEAVTRIIAVFPRYRTYLPWEPEEAAEVIEGAVSVARHASPNVDANALEFVRGCLLEPRDDDLEGERAAFVGRFQQHTAPVAAKGVEDTAFYRYVPLAALNEVGGEPAAFALEPQVFHSRARYRAQHLPRTLLATATHDHKRGEDTRARLAVLSEAPELWQEAVQRLGEVAREHWRHLTPLGSSPVRPRDEYLFYQHLAALLDGEQPGHLAERLEAYLRKAAREAKEDTSWTNPDERYEEALLGLARAVTTSERTAGAIAELARTLARYGFRNSLAQLVLKLTSPGVPDLYQGTELLDLSLVDPDNRRPVDYARRAALLDELEDAPPDAPRAAAWQDEGDERLKLHALATLLRFRRDRPEAFAGDYRPLPAEGAGAEHLLAYARAGGGAQVLVVVQRFGLTLERAGGWAGTRLPLPPELAGGGWRELLTGAEPPVAEVLDPAALPLCVAVLHRDGQPTEPKEAQ